MSMNNQNFVDEDMDLARYGEKVGMAGRTDSLPGFFMQDEGAEYAGGDPSTTSSVAIPSNGRTNHTDISEVNESLSPPFTTVLQSMPEMPPFSSFLSPPVSEVSGDQPPRYPGPGYRGIYGGGFHNFAPEHYATMLMQAAPTNGRGKNKKFSLPAHPAHNDNLGLVYGQNFPEHGFSGLKQPVMNGNHLNMLYPQHHQYQADMASQATSQLPGSLSGSLFQFRAQQPASTEQIVEKQKKRKESHNAVERRRRDHINEMIQLLGQLVDEGDNESVRLNKGEILQKAVERIRYLEQVVGHQTEHLQRIDPNYQLPQIVIVPTRSLDEAEEDE